MRAVTEERLSEVEVKFSDKHACCVIMASEGYPEKYEKGFEMTIADEVQDQVYVAGARIEDGKLLTDGGRVVGCTAVADSLEEAIEKAYEVTSKVNFENSYMRHDIGQRALKAYKG